MCWHASTESLLKPEPAQAVRIANYLCNGNYAVSGGIEGIQVRSWRQGPPPRPRGSKPRCALARTLNCPCPWPPHLALRPAGRGAPREGLPRRTRCAPHFAVAASEA